MERETRAVPKVSGLTQRLFSWSLEDIQNEDLYKTQVEKIPGTFQSAEHYFASFVYPLLEETRAQLSLGLELISRAPFAEVICIDKVEPDEELLYNVRVDYWRNRSAGRCLDPYRTVPGDLVIFADAKLETFSDIQCLGRKTWAFALVTEVRENEIEDDGTTVCFKVRVSKERTEGDGKNKWTFMYFLINITTGERIWNALHMSGNLNIIKQVLFTDSTVKESCELCPESSRGVRTETFGTILSSKLNKSQMAAVLASLRKIHCNHKSSVELICGPPGTGKTRTISALLCALLGTNIRTLTCAPTAVAVKEVASRVMKHLKESFETDPQKDASICSLGDLLFFGDYDSTAVGSEMKEIYLDHRVERLAKCFEPLNGWRHSFNSMIVFLEGGVSEDRVSEDELSKMEEGSIDGSKGKRKTYLQLAREQFKSTSLHLREVVITLSTHIPKSFIMEHNFQAMLSLLGFLRSFESLLHQDNMVSEELENLFAGKKNVKHSSKSVADSSTLMEIRSECLHILKNLRNSLDELQFPKNNSKDLLIDFCFQTASSIFSTASDSHKLHLVDMKPLNILVIDEAAQLRECESTIPLQLPGIKLAILIGDKFQLPSRVTSNICDRAGFGRSLYERLSSLDHAKHFLNLQYRMHPSISLFPCSNFYANQILDAPNVKHKAYEKKYLPDPVFRPYLFINISCGREEVDEVGHSVKNMVEVAVLMKIVQNLYQDWRSGIKEELRIGVLSSYTAQVLEIQERFRQKYENNDRFSVKVQTIDGFQGGEEDIILISTVRANNFGSVGVMADVKITNVALTRARHGLWILGSERTLVMSETVWKDIVHDAKDRHCLLNADEDCDLANTIFKVKTELDELDDLLNKDSSLFNSARWKVIFSENFRKAFYNLKSSHTQNTVIALLLKLSTGWRPKRRNIDLPCESSSMILKKFKVGYLYIVCSNDLEKECGYYTQVLKVWDILALEDIPKLVKHLDSLFEMYTDDYLTRCKKKSWEGELEIPMSWTTSYDIVQYKSLSNNATGRISNVSGLARRGGFENSIVSESFLIMKFYSVTFNMVRHFISGHDGRELDLPFELTDQERETIFFNRSSFILGRSGTGKTTVLGMKLFQKEQLFHIASEGLYEVEGHSSTHASQRNEIGECTGDAKGACLHQLFVTVSPRLCNAIRRQLSHFQSFASGGKFLVESSSLDLDYIDPVQFKDIPDSFVNIPSKSYPLVITFHKFLMMLDGTVGISYFSRFPDAHKPSRTVTLQSFIRSREVNYERFISSYWPYFKSHLIKYLDSSAVFTEIISHIKGGLEAGKAHDGRLSREDYLLLSEARVSTLTREQRDRVYDIFLEYEKKKFKKGEYDLSDLVMDLHFRLRNERYEGDHIDFVYIDEVQDLTMRQIALFKYVSKNIDEGFVFSGDTAQTIAKGVHFRFQDIRHLFFKEFVLGSRTDATDEKKEKGKLSKIFHLSQNFRTHAGVLNLAQSIIDLLYHFFPLTIDELNPETSLINGEAPVLIECGNFKDALSTIFGDSENAKGNAGFGAEQVILVRNDSAKEEISKYVGKKALVLTILECKGLEFRDVLLCNFFGSCPFKHWRVLYQFMNRLIWLILNPLYLFQVLMRQNTMSCALS
ncbi:uncharacterized protein LOC100855072 isoform X1 [Vitis vinifera]|uniref:uncharacterized protein LOC100855072 isoform X1 n=1 Tax=Vitis vinifera TaxID=29760 RepID=UPI00053FC735|nr:uncharacterized protein LOC100855072 isoform X1 [Vitis vinifera]|eukprot:XP_003631316.2 PREDICTED: uncharacterized protein LOC100855072 isoform X1 [Vitis vinifera]